MNDAVSWVLWNFLYFGKKIEATDFLMYNLKNKDSIIIDGLMQSLPPLGPMAQKVLYSGKRLFLQKKIFYFIAKWHFLLYLFSRVK